MFIIILLLFNSLLIKIRTEPGTDRIDHHHFLHGYNPCIPPHQLEGLSTLKTYSAADLRSSDASPMSRNNQSFSSINLAVSAPSPFRLAALKQSKVASHDMSLSTASRSMSSAAGVMNENPELRKIWQSVLRECHRADPDRTGKINRNTFISAIERGDLGKVQYYFMNAFNSCSLTFIELLR
jgi:hypothetical protein